jgi:chloramphenicol O-acetyltransferase type A
MSYYLDLDAWPRREVFEFYRRFDKPYFNVCLKVDVTELLNELRRREKRPSVWLTYHYLALRAQPMTLSRFIIDCATARCWSMR